MNERGEVETIVHFDPREDGTRSFTLSELRNGISAIPREINWNRFTNGQPTIVKYRGPTTQRERNEVHQRIQNALRLGLFL